MNWFDQIEGCSGIVAMLTFYCLIHEQILLIKRWHDNKKVVKVNKSLNNIEIR